jgi:diketogulonate reductase-like aldo/keto reductase
MKRPTLSRRQFAARAAALGVSLPFFSGRQAAQALMPAAPPTPRRVKLPDGTAVPALGQGCWHLGQDRHPAAVEAEALRTGIGLGMSLLDTSGNYGGGRSEEFLSQVIGAERERLFLVSKVEANEVAGDGIARACAASLARLGTGYLDLYLLHWPVPSALFPGVVSAFEQLRAAGKIRAWGVSNFSADQMEDLFRVPDGARCATNQVPYSLNNRRIEHGVLPWCRERQVPVMAYSPLGGDHRLVIGDPRLAAIGARHGASAAAVALAWVMRSGSVIAIPESGSPEHARENAAALSLDLTPKDIEELEAAFPA